MSKKVWITWEDHRRSRELAKEFNAYYIPILLDAKRYIRYPVLAIRTFSYLCSSKPKIVFCQNPSIVLAGLLVLLKPIFRYYLIVDRHSNFKLEKAGCKSIQWRAFHFLSRISVRNADMTIVTNKVLKEVCDRMGGKSIVLQDKIPFLHDVTPRQRPEFMAHVEKYQVVAVTTFDEDEPIDEIVAASSEQSDFVIYLTGNFKKKYSGEQANALSKKNIILTGFIPDSDYLALMEWSDLVVVLTDKDNILNCGAYEAISLEKPLLLSDTETLKSYFRDAAIYTKNKEKYILESIEESLRNCQSRKDATALAKVYLMSEWNKRFKAVCDIIYTE
ncbi:MAG: hypothetical protein IBX64_12235 [Actinobacteria bacterium]|nr:hypothetical protein [Actinomycetota bacterium]